LATYAIATSYLRTKERLQRIVRMLLGLLKRLSTRDYNKGNEET